MKTISKENFQTNLKLVRKIVAESLDDLESTVDKYTENQMYELTSLIFKGDTLISRAGFIAKQAKKGKKEVVKLLFESYRK